MSTPTLSSRNPGGLSSKALKTMGLSVDDIFETFVSGQQGRLPRNEYSLFWQSLMDASQSRDIEKIIRLIVQRLNEVLDETSTRISCPHYSLVNTLYFVLIWLPVKSSTVLKNCAKSLSERGDDLPETLLKCGAYEVFKSFHARFWEEGRGLQHLISQVHMMHSPETYKAIAEISTIDRLELSSRSFAAVPHYIMRFCSNEKLQSVMLAHCTDQLISLNSDNSFSNGAEDSLLALLHLLRSFLSNWRIHDVLQLKTTIEAVNPFFLWPTPYSLVARRVLLMLRHEILAPGNSILERFAAESRVPETTITSTDEHSRSRPVFYIVDGACPESSNWAFVLNLSPADEFMSGDDKIFASGLSTEVQALLLLNILKDDSLDPQDIYCITENDVAVLFGETVNILQEALEMTEDEALEHRQRNFQLIRSQFSKLAKSNTSDKIQSDLKLPATLPVGLLPELPEIAHVHWLVNRDYHFPSIELVTQLGYTPYPKTPVSARLERIIRLYEAFADASDPVEVRLCIAGGDSIIHQVATAYVDIISRSPELLHGMLLRFFLVPFRPSLLASYLARHDSWYHRHIYEPFRTPNHIVPTLRVDSALHEKPKDELLPPGMFLRSNIESYLRETEYTFQVKLFKIEGWKAASTHETTMPDLVIPLVERAEIGKVATAMLFKNMGKDGTMCSVLDLADAFKDKEFQYVPLEFNVNMTFVNLKGEECERNYERGARKQQNAAPGATETTMYESMQSTMQIDDDDDSSEEPIPFERIVLANVPCAMDPTVPANPRDPWLELFAKVADSKTKLKNRYSFLMQEPQQHINRLRLTSARDDQLFRVVVDGEFFGTFHSIQVSPVTDASNRHVTLPLSSFFPVQG